MTDKTFTSPVFQGTLDGWISANETWTYATASTITVPTGAASKYHIGDKIKWTQTTVKYGVIVGVADTVLTIAVNTDYVVTNAAITLNSYSHAANPLGFPPQFVFTVTVTGFSSAPTGMLGAYVTIARMVTYSVNMPNTGTSNATSFTISSLPFTSYAGGTTRKWVGECSGGNDNGVYQQNPQATMSENVTAIDLLTAGGSANWTASGTKNVTYTTLTHAF